MLLISAGHDTVANSLAHVVYHLATHPTTARGSPPTTA